MNTEELISLNEEIAGMARAGLPLDQGLAAMAREMGRGRLQRVTAAVADDLRAGATLPEALERQRRRLPPYYSSLVATGVRTGRIGEVLATLTIYARTMANVRTIVLDALFYPIIVAVFAFALLAATSYMILPQFDAIFRDFNMKLPAATEVLMAIGRHPSETVVLPPLILLVGILLLWQALKATARGRRIRARWLYLTPVIGTLVRSARLAAFADLLGILVDHEIPLPDAFQLAGESSADPMMADAAVAVKQGLSEGQPLGEVLRGRGLVPEWVSWMAALGEKRGALGKSLHQIAEMYRRQVELRAALLRNVLPPFFLIITAGAFFGVFVMSICLPLVKLLEGLARS